jgi:hypothetical protein
VLFRSAQFRGHATFERLNARGPVDFTGASFEAGADLRNLVSSSSLSLRRIQIIGETRACGEGAREPPRGGHACLFIEGIGVQDVHIDVGAVAAVHGRVVQKQTLLRIERSAEARKDIPTANGARFRRLSMEGDEKTGLARHVDTVLYRGVAGYLVRPSHPLLTFLLLLMAASFVRAFRARRRGPHREASAGGLLAMGLAASLPVALRRKPEVAVADVEGVRSSVAVGGAWLEFLAYRVLAAVFLVALGNSNATIRQILDSVLGG